MTTRLSAIEAAAKAASKGSWSRYGRALYAEDGERFIGNIREGSTGELNATFIATLDPPTALWLVGLVRRLRQLLVEARDFYSRTPLPADYVGHRGKADEITSLLRDLDAPGKEGG